MHCFACQKYSHENPGLGFYQFPNDERCQAWLQATGKPILAKYTPEFCNRNLLLCADHFEENMIMSNKKLIKNAYPTIFTRGFECFENIEVIHDNEMIQDNMVEIQYKEADLDNVGNTVVISDDEADLDNVENMIVISDDETNQNNTTVSTDVNSITTTLEASSLTQKSKQNNLGLLMKNKKNRMSMSLLEKKEFFEDVLDFIQLNFPPQLATFLKLQLNSNTSEYQRFGLNLYILRPSLYTFFLKIFKLPSIKYLRKITASWDINVGLNNFIIQSLRTKIHSLKEEGRYCTLCLGEMDVKPHLYYNITTDTLVGLHHLNGQKTSQLATKALILMLRGVNSNWHLPLGYFFVNSATPSDDLKHVVLNTIKQCEKINVKIIAIVSDLSTNFYDLAFSQLKVTHEKPYFYVKGNKIFYIFDTPDLLKLTRDNFFEYTFKVNEGFTNKNYITEFYNHDSKLTIKLAPKLTIFHLNPTDYQKRLVKYAAQIFSAKVAAGLNTYILFGRFPSKARATAHFINNMDQLFDILNSRNLRASKYFKKPFIGSKEQVQFLENMELVFQNMDILNGAGESVINSKNFHKGWQITISSILGLWEEMKEKSNIPYLKTGRLNLDCLKIFFRKIKLQSCKTPTSIAFQNAFRKLFFSYIFGEFKDTKYCLNDFDDILSAISSEKLGSFKKVNEKKNNLIIKTKDYSSLYFFQKNSFWDFGEYLILNCLKEHSCKICIEYSKFLNNASEDTKDKYFRIYENGAKNVFENLSILEKNFFAFLGACEHIFSYNFKVHFTEDQIGYKIKYFMSNFKFNHPCPSFPKDHLVTLFIRTRMFYTLKSINGDIKKLDKKETYELRVIKNLS